METRVIRLTYTPAERVKSLISPAFAPYIRVEPADPRDPNNHPSIVTITAPPAIADRIATELRGMDTRPRQVLLDARVMAMSHRDLFDLGIEWGVSPLMTNDPSDKRGIQVGYAQDRASTDSLLAGLNQLTENGRAELIMAPQLIAQDGQPSRVPTVISQVWYYMIGESRTGQGTKHIELEKIDGGTSLSITPHVGDHDDITLELAFETSKSRPNSQRDDPPVVVRRTVENATTVDDGGTAAWAGLTTGLKHVPGLAERPLVGALFRSNDQDQTPRRIVVFVTAHLIRDDRSTE